MASGSRLQAPCSRFPSAACCLQPAACRGFSLIEVVIALSILAVGLLGAMRAFPLGLRASQRTALSSRATIVAQRTIEALKLISPDELPAGETVQQEDGFEVATRVATPDVEGLVDASQLKEITVTVQWEQGNRTRDLSFVTYGWLDTS